MFFIAVCQFVPHPVSPIVALTFDLANVHNNDPVEASSLKLAIEATDFPYEELSTMRNKLYYWEIDETVDIDFLVELFDIPYDWNDLIRRLANLVFLMTRERDGRVSIFHLRDVVDVLLTYYVSHDAREYVIDKLEENWSKRFSMPEFNALCRPQVYYFPTHFEVNPSFFVNYQSPY